MTGTSRQIKRRWHMLGLLLLTLLVTLPGLSAIPAIDRDEARYLQSSAQMAESGDWLNIRYQDEARNKKPAGAYWAQTAMIHATGGPDTRRIWAQRLPSVFAAILSVLLTYLAVIPILGRRGAVIAASLLSVTILFGFEAHLAKTDALLCASGAAVFCALARLRAGRVRGMAYLFWIALGLAMMIKGPVIPAIATLAILTLLIWERKTEGAGAWIKALLRPLPILLFILIWLPWAIAIYLETDGAFFAESLGRDFGGKLVSVQESHPGPPGYHLVASLFTTWPAVLFIIPGLVFAWQSARRGGASLPAKGMRLCLAWVVPIWILLELMPTKLPHYTLPLFPALMAMAAGAVLTLSQIETYGRARWVGAIAFLIGTAGIVATVIGGPAAHSPESDLWVAALVGALGAILAIAALILFLKRRVVGAWIGAVLASLTLTLPAYGYLIPRLDALWVGHNLAAEARVPLVSPTFAEPSLVYHFGQEVILSNDPAAWDDFAAWADGTLAIDLRSGKALYDDVMFQAEEMGVCLSEQGRIRGENYSKADPVEIVLLRQIVCPPSGELAAGN